MQEVKSSSSELDMVEFQVQFLQASAFQSAYFRNNRAFGQKNIRCFPTCAALHVGKHFCGRPVVTSITMKTPIQIASLEGALCIQDLHMIAEFVMLEGTDSSGHMLFSGGADNFLEESLSSTKESASKLPLYFVGKIIRISEKEEVDGKIVSSCIVEFNSGCRGWHYGWTGCRFKTDVRHALMVNLYVPIRTRQIFLSSAQRYAKVGSFPSPLFMIESLRRKLKEDDGDDVSDVEDAVESNKSKLPVALSYRQNTDKKHKVETQQAVQLNQSTASSMLSITSAAASSRPFSQNNIPSIQSESSAYESQFLSNSSDQKASSESQHGGAFEGVSSSQTEIEDENLEAI